MMGSAIFFAGVLFGILGLTGVKHYMHHRQTANLKQAWEHAQDLDDSLFQRINSRMRQQQTILNSLMKTSMDELAKGETDDLGKGETDELANGEANPFKDEGEKEKIAVDTAGSNIIYRVPIDDIANKKVKVDVQDGMVTVTTRTAQSKEDTKGERSSTVISQFQKTFPLVAGANPAKMDFTIQKDLIVIRFPKLKGA